MMNVPEKCKTIRIQPEPNRVCQGECWSKSTAPFASQIYGFDFLGTDSFFDKNVTTLLHKIYSDRFPERIRSVKDDNNDTTMDNVMSTWTESKFSDLPVSVSEYNVITNLEGRTWSEFWKDFFVMRWGRDSYGDKFFPASRSVNLCFIF